MKHPMLEYWNIAFARYKVADGEFYVPELPDPILSPRFGKTNIIQPLENEVRAIEGFKVRNDMYLCRFKIIKQDSRLPVVIEPLSAARESATHKALLKDAFSQDYEFLLKLEKFLPTLDATYEVGTILNEQETPVASVTMGITGKVAVLISGLVHSKFRDQKNSRKIMSLVHHMAGRHGVEEVFYWTKSERLLPYADKVDRYLVYVPR